jgi:hypothetical protein
MEKNKEAGINSWVEERLNALTPGDQFRPNAASALARFRSLRGMRSYRAQMWGWTAATASAVFLFVFALPAPRAVAQRCLSFCYVSLLQRAPLPDHPEYVGAQLVRPANYREWIYLSSGLGMEYNATAGGPENFTNVFVAPWAYREFISTGKWPDKAMFVLEGRASQSNGSINKSGHFQADLKSLSVEVKDEKRFADKWAYFSFRGDTTTAEAMTGPADACWHCHDSNAAVEHTFIQFYPTLKPVALKFGTFKAQAE